MEALNHKESGLTYPALVGLRKQSVFIARVHGEKGYTCETDYISAVSGWRWACDDRGLSELQRCRFNYQMLNYIIKELVPWYHQTYDFSLLEVNRYVYTLLLCNHCT